MSTQPIARQHRARRGSAYLAILGTSLIATTLLAGAIYAQQVKVRADRNSADGAIARQAAEAGIEYARAWIAKTPAWRTGTVVSLTNVTLGRAKFDVQFTDPIDADVADYPYDPVDVTCTARVGRAEQIVSARLTATPIAFDSLGYAFHSGGKLELFGQFILGASSASVDKLTSYGTVEGNVVANNVKTLGTVTGSVRTNVAARSMPGSTVADWYASLGTRLYGATYLDKRVLSANSNPFGASNPDGIYVIRENSDVLIRNTRLLGTLVVICPGRTVTIDSNVLLESANRDYPVLIVDGDLQISYSTDGEVLSESANGVNFNPVGTPYAGSTDSDTADVYPSEIHGLVHATGQYSQWGTSTMRGALLIGSFATVYGSQTIVYDPALAAWPPVGYAKQVDMPLTAGSVQRTVR